MCVCVCALSCHTGPHHIDLRNRCYMLTGGTASGLQRSGDCECAAPHLELRARGDVNWQTQPGDCADMTLRGCIVRGRSWVTHNRVVGASGVQSSVFRVHSERSLRDTQPVCRSVSANCSQVVKHRVNVLCVCAATCRGCSSSQSCLLGVLRLQIVQRFEQRLSIQRIGACFWGSGCVPPGVQVWWGCVPPARHVVAFLQAAAVRNLQFV